jgi:hypothetical protein
VDLASGEELTFLLPELNLSVGSLYGLLLPLTDPRYIANVNFRLYEWIYALSIFGCECRQWYS